MRGHVSYFLPNPQPGEFNHNYLHTGDSVQSILLRCRVVDDYVLIDVRKFIKKFLNLIELDNTYHDYSYIWQVRL